MRPFKAVAVGLFIAFMGLSYQSDLFFFEHRPIVTAERFILKEIASQNKINKVHGLPKVENSKRITACILEYGKKYAPTNYITVTKFQKILTRLARRESDFKRTAYNKKSKAIGLYQHLPVWDYLVYKIDGGQLGKHIRKNKITNIRKYFKRIGYSTESGSISLRQFIIQYKGNLYHAVSNYGGWTIEGSCPVKASKYINYVLDIE